MTTSTDQRYYVFGGFSLDAGERRLLGANGEPISLSSRAFDVLHYLVQHPGEIIDKGTLMTAVWPNSIVEENNLNQAIAALRKALGEVAGEHRFIITIPGRGYRFVPEVRTPSSLQGSPTPAVPQPEGVKAITGSVTGSSIRPSWLAAIALVIVAVIAFWVYQHGQSAPPAAVVEKPTQAVTPANPPTPEKSVTVVGVPLQSVAVLPFTDLSPEKDQEYFADGVAEEVLNQLSRINDLFVVGRASSFSFKGKNVDLRVIGEKLGVAHLLEGSIRKDGDRFRITAQLVNAADGYNLWSQSYDRDLNDIFAIQEEIAKSVAETLQITLGVGQLGRTPGMTRNVKAYDAYLAGRSLMYQPNRDSISRAIEHLEQAVTLDPEFAVAWYSLTEAYSYGDIIPERAGEFLAKRDAARARVIELVPESDYALLIKAALSGDMVEVERLFKQALARNPANFETNNDYARFLNGVGRPTEAINYFRRAIHMEPLSSFPLLQLGLSYEYKGNFDAAVAAMKQGRKLTSQPSLFNGGLQILALDENERAHIDEYFTLTATGANEFNPIADRPGSRDLNKIMYTLLDTPEGASVELRRFMTDPAYTGPINRSIIAAWASYYGEHELALQIYRELIESSIRPISVSKLTIIWRPIHQTMRRLSGFKDLVTKLGLVDYWRVTGKWGDFCRPVGEDDFECK